MSQPVADKFVIDVLKTLTLSSVARRGLPEMPEVVAVATGMGVYWFVIHKVIEPQLLILEHGLADKFKA